jgi:hypothetical protein
VRVLNKNAVTLLIFLKVKKIFMSVFLIFLLKFHISLFFYFYPISKKFVGKSIEIRIYSAQIK